MRKSDRLPRATDSFALGMALVKVDLLGVQNMKGVFTFHMVDGATGKVLHHFEKENLIVKDAGIMVARLLANSLSPTLEHNNGVTMLAVGTGATGPLLGPDAPQDTQRRLNVEIARKPFSSYVFRNAAGAAVTFPTHVVDFTVTYGEAEAVGPLNEMGLLSTRSMDPTIKAPIMNGPSGYDATIDVSAKDLLLNYLPFACVAKPAGAVLTLGWRITC